MRIDTIPEGALLMYDNNQQSALGVKNCKVNMAGRKYDQMAAKKNQSYYFIFVHEDGAGLEQISDIFAERHIEASVDEVFSLDEVNDALQKVAAGKSKGKTILKINE